MAFQVYYPTIGMPRRRPCMFIDEDDDSLFVNPFINRRNPLAALEIVADELLRRSRQQQSNQNDKKSQNNDVNDDADGEVAKHDDKQLTINLDMSGFEPANIRVKTFGRRLIVEGSQEDETNEQGIQSYSRKHFHRSITLPKNVNPDHVISTLTNKGVLRISAPVMSLPPVEQAKEIEINREDEKKNEEETGSSSKSEENNETSSA